MIRRRADEDLAGLAIRDFAWLQRERDDSGPQLGQYRLEVAPDGNFEMRLPAELLQGVGRFLIATADREFGAWVSRPLVPAADGSLELGSVALAPAPRVVAGEVLDPEGRPVANASLALLEPTGSRDAQGDEYLVWCRSLHADERGRFDVALWTVCDELQVSPADQGRLVGRKTRFRSGAEGVVVGALPPGRLQGRIDGPLDLPYGTLTVDGLVAGRIVLGSIPVSADGRFEAFGVQPGTYDLQVASSFTGEVLARLDGVEVPSGGPAQHPGLDALSLDVGARFLQVQVVDEQGNDLGEYLVVHGATVGGAPHPGPSVLGPRFVVATTDDGCDLVVNVPERRLARLAGLRRDARVAVLPPIDVDLRIDWEAVGFPRGLRLHLDLGLPEQQGIRPAVDSSGTFCAEPGGARYGPGMSRALFLLALTSFAPWFPLVAQVVPQPRSMSIGSETVAGAGVACTDPASRATVEALVEALRRLGVADAAMVAPEAASLVFAAPRGEESDDRAEGYRIDVVGEQLRIAASGAGVARAAASLLQLVKIDDGAALWPQVAIDDAPGFDFRCFMVDMGRNPHRLETLRKVVDALWLLKVRYLQLHLTDDQLFSWPSQAFPKLRSARAGWTRDDFVALEAYAQARGVTIIPELDVPGHSTILRREYPEVFGESTTDLATKPEATRGVERLLAEMLEVFRATPYVHVGGDEAYGVPEDAQRDFLNRLNRFVRSTGRRMVVWEGPSLGAGEHKVDTDVLHVNWETVLFPAQQMLDAGYQVVNAAWDPLYVVDHYPRTMFTAVALERCYGWDPRRFGQVNDGMPTFVKPHVTGSAEGILGFCMPWWEGREDNLLALCVPRLAAVNARAWSGDAEPGFADFERRWLELRPRLETLLETSLTGIPLAPDVRAAADAVGENLALGAGVLASTGGSQPVFGPWRLTNGVTDRFDHFLGFPTNPEPLRITIDLGEPRGVSRIVVHETAVGGSHELYTLRVSADGASYLDVGTTTPQSRGEQSFVAHRFEPRKVRFVQIETRGCHGLTFPAFSRLCEVEVFAR